MFRAIKLALTQWYWRNRLGHARDFAHNLEGTIMNERARAARDVQHCEVMLSRANVARIEYNADRRMAAVQRS